MIDFKFNNISLRDKGLILEEIPNVPKASSKKEIIEIPGRDGYISFEDKSIRPIVIEVICVLTNIENYSEIKAILSGKGKLSIPPELDRYYDAEIIEEAVPEKIYKNYKRIVFPFLCQPYSYGEKRELILTEDVVLNNKGTYSMEYKLEVTGTGVIKIEANNKSLEIEVKNNETVIIDQVLKIFTNQLGENKSNQVTGELIEIEPGDNEITYSVLSGTIIKTKLIYQERYL